MSLPPGQSFGNFEIVSVLGHGATGTVYRARQTNLGRECALKVLAPELVRDGKFLERFRREGQIAAALRHSHIVRIFDLVEASGDYAIAMDYIQGVELQSLLEGGEKMSPTRALKIMLPIFEALEYAHSKGVVHRDIKPANILIEDESGQAYLTDFSIARMTGVDKLTQTGTIIGTPEYMAPEQFDGKDVDARADIYAATLILYEMLAGVNPFRGETLAEVVKKQILVDPPLLRGLADVPAPLEALIHKGLAKGPDDRIGSAVEMRQSLSHLLSGPSTNLIEPSPRRTELLHRFLEDVETGQMSMDDAIIAREKMKEAIDRGFKRMLSIVMLDLAGSSKIKVPNQTLIADRAFRDYRATINAILEEQGCERYDWSGDGAIALFTDPVAAVNAAVKVQLSVSAVGDRHAHLPDALKVRIGIRTGLVYHDPRRSLGEFASRTVDQAGHLEKDCPPGMIHVGEETAAAVSGMYPLRSIGKNRDDVEVHEIDVSVISQSCTERLSASLPSALSSGSETARAPQEAQPVAFQAPPTTQMPALAQTPPPLPSHPAAAQAPALTSLRSQPAANMAQSLSAASVAHDLPAASSAEDEPPPLPPLGSRTGRSMTVSSPVEDSEDASAPQSPVLTGPWWGWRYMALAFFLFWGATVIDSYLSLPSAVLSLFRMALGIQLMLALPYALVCLIGGKARWALQAAIAFVIFTAGFIVVASN